MNVTPADLVDRYTILVLKLLHLNPCPPDMEKEYLKYLRAVTESPMSSSATVDQLFEVNGAIWDLESDIRQGKLANPTTEAEYAEIGRRALAIRDLNAKRIAIKNEITKVYGGFIEVKGQHASAIG